MDAAALRQEIAARWLADALRSGKAWLRDGSLSLGTRKAFARASIRTARFASRALA